MKQQCYFSLHRRVVHIEGGGICLHCGTKGEELQGLTYSHYSQLKASQKRKIARFLPESQQDSIAA